MLVVLFTSYQWFAICWSTKLYGQRNNWKKIGLFLIFLTLFNLKQKSFKKNLQDMLFGMETYLKLTTCSANGWQINVMQISLISSCSPKILQRVCCYEYHYKNCPDRTRKFQFCCPLVHKVEFHAEIGLFISKIWGKRIGKRHLYQEPFSRKCYFPAVLFSWSRLIIHIGDEVRVIRTKYSNVKIFYSEFWNFFNVKEPFCCTTDNRFPYRSSLGDEDKKNKSPS